MTSRERSVLVDHLKTATHQNKRQKLVDAGELSALPPKITADKSKCLDSDYLEFFGNFFLCSRESKMSKLFEIRIVMAKGNFPASSWPNLMSMSNRIGADIDCAGFKSPRKCYELLSIASDVQLEDDKQKIKQSSNGIQRSKSCLEPKFSTLRKFKKFSVLDSKYRIFFRWHVVTSIPNSTNSCTFNQVSSSSVFLVQMLCIRNPDGTTLFGDLVELKPDLNADLSQPISLENSKTLLKTCDNLLEKFAIPWSKVSMMLADGGKAGQLCIQMVSKIGK